MNSIATIYCVIVAVFTLLGLFLALLTAHKSEHGRRIGERISLINQYEKL